MTHTPIWSALSDLKSQQTRLKGFLMAPGGKILQYITQCIASLSNQFGQHFKIPQILCGTKTPINDQIDQISHPPFCKTSLGTSELFRHTKTTWEIDIKCWENSQILLNPILSWGLTKGKQYPLEPNPPLTLRGQFRHSCFAPRRWLWGEGHDFPKILYHSITICLLPTNRRCGYHGILCFVVWLTYGNALWWTCFRTFLLVFVASFSYFFGNFLTVALVALFVAISHHFQHIWRCPNFPAAPLSRSFKESENKGPS